MSAAPSTAQGESAAQAATIRRAQKKLQKQGLYQGPVDGVAGPETMDAVKAFQRKEGLPETGYLDAKTLDEMDVKVKSHADRNTLEKAAHATGEGVRKGGEATGKGIHAAGRGTHASGEPVDNAVDKAGNAAGKGLEKGIDATGDGLEAGLEGAGTGLKKAGGAIKEVFDKDEKTAAVDANASYDTRQTVDDTRKAQAKLAAMGYYEGNVDGVMGPNTEEAIREFQAKHKLTQTGQLDANTRKKLDLD
ncbi:MAG: peptidoglycan-binding protein [Bryobacterales bacterium]|nr:peptidoglycan-binding protein [Bryobacterales bacterium]